MELPPLVYELLTNRRFVFSIAVFLAVVLIGLLGPVLYGRDPYRSVGGPTEPPSPEYPLGTDNFGRDILAELLVGTRNSLYVGLLTAAIALAIGTVVGAVAGVKGGLVDEALMALTNIVLSIPSILLAILIAAYLEVRSIEVIALIIGATTWPWYARALRAQIMSLKEREFVYLSRIAGYSDVRIAFEDLLPNIATYVFMALAIFINAGILGEASLSFIGVGPTKAITLGIMLYWAQQYLAVPYGYWWWWLPPGLIIVAATSSLIILSTAVDEVFNPRLREA